MEPSSMAGYGNLTYINETAPAETLPLADTVGVFEHIQRTLWFVQYSVGKVMKDNCVADIIFWTMIAVAILTAVALVICVWALLVCCKETARQKRLSVIVELEPGKAGHVSFDHKYGNGTEGHLGQVNNGYSKASMPAKCPNLALPPAYDKEVVPSYKEFQEEAETPSVDSALPAPFNKGSLGSLLLGYQYNSASVWTVHVVSGVLSSGSAVTKSEQLIVHIQKATGLPAMDSCGTSDPYIKLMLLPDQKPKYETKVRIKTLNPVFDEKFLFMTTGALDDKKLSVTLYDFNRFSKDQPIGRIVLPVRDFVQKPSGESWHDILPVSAEEQLGSDHLGMLLVSLSYIPPVGRLTVQIQEARDLKRMDVIGLSDPFVKLAVMLDGKLLKKAKTTKKKNTLNPNFRESFVFDLVPFDQIQKVVLILTVMDHDRIGSSDRIGKVVLSSVANGDGLDHWQEMLAKPRDAIERWHVLKPCW